MAESLETRITANPELWAMLVRCYESQAYSWYSDDGSVVQPSIDAWEKALAAQEVFTLDEVRAEFTDRHNRAVEIMNAEFAAEQAARAKK